MLSTIELSYLYYECGERELSCWEEDLGLLLLVLLLLELSFCLNLLLMIWEVI